ncbi:hypothetical protein B0H14DRAFT_3451615 [Mycena olivaceomarginata]|nr:hypothetical protein B0H14DRAFT_3451615 [Mycena olivaceomarginata]
MVRRMGAYTQLWGATIVSPEEINGKFLVPWGKIGSADERASNKELEDERVTYNNKLSVTANSRLCNPARALQGALGYLTGELD